MMHVMTTSCTATANQRRCCGSRNRCNYCCEHRSDNSPCSSWP